MITNATVTTAVWVDRKSRGPSDQRPQGGVPSPMGNFQVNNAGFYAFILQKKLLAAKKWDPLQC